MSTHSILPKRRLVRLALGLASGLLVFAGLLLLLGAGSCLSPTLPLPPPDPPDSKKPDP